MYIYQLPDWPRLTWNREQLAESLATIRHFQGRLIGRMEALGFSLRQEAILQTLTTDVLKTSEIEGETLDAAQVRSSIARRLGMDVGTLNPVDRTVEGIVEMMLDATRHYDQLLTAERLFAWHASPEGNLGSIFAITQIARYSSARDTTMTRRISGCCHADCLMGNHYQLLIETPEAFTAVGRMVPLAKHSGAR
jgi:hypothetical protein